MVASTPAASSASPRKSSGTPADTGLDDVVAGLMASSASAAMMTPTATRSARCSGLPATRADAGTTRASPAAENAWTSDSGATAMAPMCSTEPNRLVPMPTTQSGERRSARTVATGAAGVDRGRGGPAQVLQEVAGVERQRGCDREAEAEEEHAAMVLAGALPPVGDVLGCC